MLKLYFGLIAPNCSFELTIIGDKIFTSLPSVCPKNDISKSGEMKEMINAEIK